MFSVAVEEWVPSDTLTTGHVQCRSRDTTPRFYDRQCCFPRVGSAPYTDFQPAVSAAGMLSRWTSRFKSCTKLSAGIQPWDQLEIEHLADTLNWLETTNDAFRRAKPSTPDRHLVCYVVMVDPDDGSTLLVDNINAGLWLPPGGYMEPGDRRTGTARRETHEELRIDPMFADPSGWPSIVTVTRPGSLDAGHIDVSLWFLLIGRLGMDLSIELTEFNEAR
jgi:8-oxo-dGTP diphosphatase